MRKRLLQLLAVVGVILAVIVLLKVAPAGSATPAPGTRTAWADPDLQGIWTDEYQTPLQRPARYANKEFFTEAEREALDAQRAALLRREVRVERGTEKDVAGAYNSVFTSVRPTGRRTSMVVDPSDGRIPPVTAEA